MDASVCERLWREHADRLLLYAQAIVSQRALAEDVLQAVFARLLAAGAPTVIEDEAPYLFRAVRNEAINAMRSARRADRAREHLFDASGADPRDEAELAALRDEAEIVLARLPSEQREAIVLKIWGGLSFAEAAAVLGVSEKIAQHRYYRGLEAIEEKFHERR